MSELLSHVDLLENPIVVAHSLSNDVAIIIHTKLNFNQWESKEVEDLMFYLNVFDVERDKSINLMKILPKELNKKIEEYIILNY